MYHLRKKFVKVVASPIFARHHCPPWARCASCILLWIPRCHTLHHSPSSCDVALGAAFSFLNIARSIASFPTTLPLDNIPSLVDLRASLISSLPLYASLLLSFPLFASWIGYWRGCQHGWWYNTMCDTAYLCPSTTMIACHAMAPFLPEYGALFLISLLSMFNILCTTVQKEWHQPPAPQPFLTVHMKVQILRV